MYHELLKLSNEDMQQVIKASMANFMHHHKTVALSRRELETKKNEFEFEKKQIIDNLESFNKEIKEIYSSYFDEIQKFIQDQEEKLRTEGEDKVNSDCVNNQKHEKYLFSLSMKLREALDIRCFVNPKWKDKKHMQSS
jgi:hypothetical protein